MIANDMMNLVGKLSLLVALSLAGCFMILEKKRSPLGLTLLALALVIFAGQFVRMPDGRSANQYYIAKMMRSR